MDERVVAETLRVLRSLPRHARWRGQRGTLDFSFDTAFRRLEDHDRVGAPIVDAWRDLMIFGRMSVNEGGGSEPVLAIEPVTATVVGLDVERDDDEAVYFVNSSARQFVEFFTTLDAFLGVSEPVPSRIIESLMRIDEQALAHREWPGILDFLLT